MGGGHYSRDNAQCLHGGVVRCASGFVQVYNKRIETEGFAAMAASIGVKSHGLPNVEIIHR